MLLLACHMNQSDLSINHMLQELKTLTHLMFLHLLVDVI